MKYVDYDWDLRKDKIVLDRELDIDKLEWQAGDHFEVRNTDGRVELVKVDPVVKFVKGYK
jgi:RecA-family ATPase